MWSLLMQMQHTVSVRIEIPALDKLVEYLQSASDQQAKIDSLAASVSALTAKLQHSNTELDSAIQGAK